MIIQQAGSLSFSLQKPFDFSFLHCYGQPFQVFDQQDSGYMGFGLEHGGRRYFPPPVIFILPSSFGSKRRPSASPQ